MSWIYLIVAGLFEVAFTSCMGKVKETTGSEMYWWFTGFLISMSISMFLQPKPCLLVRLMPYGQE